MNFPCGPKIKFAKFSTNIQYRTTKATGPSVETSNSQMQERETHRKS